MLSICILLILKDHVYVILLAFCQNRVLVFYYFGGAFFLDFIWLAGELRIYLFIIIGFRM